MRIKTVNISDKAESVLKAAKWSDDLLVLKSGQLERPLYVEVDKVLRALGGKWDRFKGGHVFEENTRRELTAALRNGHVIDEKQTYQAFYTPPTLAAEMALTAQIKKGDRVLEPSAGAGAIVRELRVWTDNITVCEIRPELKPALAKFGVCFAQTDFLKYNPRVKFRAIVANPPFNDGQDIGHASHMLDLLAPDGRLVCVLPAGTLKKVHSKTVAFIQKLTRACHQIEYRGLAENTFKESGTGVNAILLIATKRPEEL